MELYDLRHFVKEETIEFEVKALLTEKKKIHFKNGEPVAFSEAAGHYVIGSEADTEKVAEVMPANEHYKLVLRDILATGKIYLANVLNHSSRLLQVAFKIYADCKTINYSVYVSEAFLGSVRNTVNLRDPRNPKQGIEEGTLYASGGYTYAVIGRHIREDKKGDKHFIIAGRDFYIRVAKKQDAQGKEYYSAEQLLKGIRARDYRFFLAKGKLKYTDDREIIAVETKELMESLSDDTYIKVWDRYGKIEQQMILKDARDLGALRYINYEREGYLVRFDIKGDQRDRLKKYAKSFRKNAVLSAGISNPYEIHREDDEMVRFFKETRGIFAKITLAESIVAENEFIRCRISEEDVKKLDHGREGYIFFSIDGDMQRINRRREAREKIESASCPMPNLALILEGQNVAAADAKRRKFTLSNKVKEEIFPEYGPYAAQEMAIEKALNTPDIMLIQGPPGTGKTTVITAILKSLNEITDPTGGIFGRDLVTAFQHDAVQNATDRIEILGLPAIKFGHKYGESEDDIVEINASVQGWINNRLSDLYAQHTGIEEHKKLGAFNKLYLDYMYSTNSIDQTLDILERIRDLVAESVSSGILTRLNQKISELEFMTGGTYGNATKSLVRAIRRIPASVAAYEDNGWFELENAIRLLRKQNHPIFAEELEALDKMQSQEKYDFARMKEIRKRLLVKTLPKKNIFTTAQKQESIKEILGCISDDLMRQEETGKNGSDLTVAQYIQELEENPLAVKEAILHYTSVNGATNQQVMRREIRDLKGGEIMYENVLVDEAARSNPLDLFIPLSIARDRIILVGDHRQLPHIIDDRIARAVEEGDAGDIRAETERQLSESMFGILFRRLQQLEARDGIKRTITLNQQFRMHPVLGTFVDKNFYSKYSESEQVTNGDPNPEHFAQYLPGIEEKACIWMDVPYAGENPGESSRSKYRDAEAKKIARHLKRMLEADRKAWKENPAGKQLTFGIITFYREQVSHINEALLREEILARDDSEHLYLNPEYRQNTRDVREIVRVGTVDAFQGMEFDIVYLSMVRSNDMAVDVTDYGSLENEKKAAVDKELQGKYGFLMFENRLCVAMSRQKKALICVGDSKMLKGAWAVIAVEPLVAYYKLCREDAYGKVI